MPSMLQLGDVNNEQGIKYDPNNFGEGKYEQIKRLIKVDLDLHQNKATEH
jgi:hypothetical protein